MWSLLSPELIPSITIIISSVWVAIPRSSVHWHQHTKDIHWLLSGQMCLSAFWHRAVWVINTIFWSNLQHFCTSGVPPNCWYTYITLHSYNPAPTITGAGIAQSV
jgi:hypothetical protein